MPRRSGLPHDEALKAITLNAAEIWGVADQLGSLDVGKTANVVVADGDPLDVKTDVKQVFIAGREIPMTSRQTRLAGPVFREVTVRCVILSGCGVKPKSHLHQVPLS